MGLALVMLWGTGCERDHEHLERRAEPGLVLRDARALCHEDDPIARVIAENAPRSRPNEGMSIAAQEFLRTSSAGDGVGILEISQIDPAVPGVILVGRRQGSRGTVRVDVVSDDGARRQTLSFCDGEWLRSAAFPAGTTVRIENATGGAFIGTMTTGRVH